MKDNAWPWIIGGGLALFLFYQYNKTKAPAPGAYPGQLPAPGSQPQQPQGVPVPSGNVWGALQGLFGFGESIVDAVSSPDTANGGGIELGDPSPGSGSGSGLNFGGIQTEDDSTDYLIGLV